MRVRLFSDSGRVVAKIDWEEPTKIKMCMYTVDLLGLKHMTTYERVKPATAGPLVDTYLELTMLCLFYFALESDKNGHNVGTAVVPEKRFSFYPFLFCFFFFLFQFPMSIVSWINSSHSSIMQ